MKLPVVAVSDAAPSREALWHHFTDLVVDHALAAGVEVRTQGVGRLIAGDHAVARRLPGVAVLPFGQATADAVAEILRTCDELGLPWPHLFADASPADLAALNLQRQVGQFLKLKAAVTRPATSYTGLILPGRAARAAYETWCAERFVDDRLAALLPRHLDDPQYEAAVAMRGRTAVGAAALQLRGNLGFICDVYVRPEEDATLAATLVGRMIELAARSQLADVYAIAIDDDTAALLHECGFVAVMNFDLLTPSSGLAGGQS